MSRWAVAEDKAQNEGSIVERWLEDQQEWQRTVLAYVDSMVENDDFLVHLGNAMRGSLLAGKPYPGTAAAGTHAAEAPSDDRLDRVLFALHQIEGQLQDLRMSLDDLRDAGATKSESNGGTAPRVRAAKPESNKLRSNKPKSNTTAQPKSKKKPAKRKVKRKVEK